MKLIKELKIAFVSIYHVEFMLFFLTRTQNTSLAHVKRTMKSF